MKIFWTTLAILLSTSGLLAQSRTYSVRGEVCGSEGTEPDYYDLIVLSRADLTSITGMSFTESEFAFQFVCREPFLVQISSLGFEDIIFECYADADEIDFGSDLSKRELSTDR